MIKFADKSAEKKFNEIWNISNKSILENERVKKYTTARRSKCH